jgi:hypothetical protein
MCECDLPDNYDRQFNPPEPIKRPNPNEEDDAYERWREDQDE